jgi:uncharacterized protein YxjI
VNQFGTLKAMPIREGKTVGSAYLTEDWAKMDFFLRPGLGVDSLNSIQANLNLQSHEFEVLNSKDIRLLPGRRVKHFRVQHPSLGVATFVNCDEYTFKGTRLDGFAKVLFEGKISLIEWHGVTVMKPNYNVALDVGSVDKTIVKKKVLYLVYDSHIYTANESNIMSLAGNKKSEVRTFIKKNKLRVKDAADLARIAEFTSTL